MIIKDLLEELELVSNRLPIVKLVKVHAQGADETWEHEIQKVYIAPSMYDKTKKVLVIE